MHILSRNILSKNIIGIAKRSKTFEINVSLSPQKGEYF